MNSSWSVALYRFLMQAYPSEFRNQYGEPVDQAFRDMHRDALRQRGYLGVALLWFHVVPDFLFSAGEVLLAKAGDFLKWRFRLQWVVACTLGFVLSRLVSVAVGWEFIRELGPWLSPFLPAVILLSSIGLMQSRVLAGRCFRKKQWVLFSIGGAVLGTIVVVPVWRSLGFPFQAWLLRITGALDGGEFLRIAAFSVFDNFQLLAYGACVGLLQSAAIRNDAITRYRWMTACSLGYYLSAATGGVFREYTPTFVAGTMISAVVTGTVLGLITAGPLERILFSVQADSEERS